MIIAILFSHPLTLIFPIGFGAFYNLFFNKIQNDHNINTLHFFKSFKISIFQKLLYDTIVISQELKCL